MAARCVWAIARNTVRKRSRFFAASREIVPCPIPVWRSRCSSSDQNRDERMLQLLRAECVAWYVHGSARQALLADSTRSPLLSWAIGQFLEIVYSISQGDTSGMLFGNCSD